MKHFFKKSNIFSSNRTLLLCSWLTSCFVLISHYWESVCWETDCFGLSSTQYQTVKNAQRTPCVRLTHCSVSAVESNVVLILRKICEIYKIVFWNLIRGPWEKIQQAISDKKLKKCSLLTFLNKISKMNNNLIQFQIVTCKSSRQIIQNYFCNSIFPLFQGFSELPRRFDDFFSNSFAYLTRTINGC